MRFAQRTFLNFLIVFCEGYFPKSLSYFHENVEIIQPMEWKKIGKFEQYTTATQLSAGPRAPEGSQVSHYYD